MGATYWKVLPISPTSVVLAAEAAASTSEKCAASLADNPKAVSESVTISETLLRSSPLAADRLITPGRPAIICSALQPAAAINPSASAHSVAPKTLSAPI